jgi:hypothetical protein
MSPVENRIPQAEQAARERESRSLAARNRIFLTESGRNEQESDAGTTVGILARGAKSPEILAVPGD